jgi:tetratricopeptide (TPR) repeat protein
LGLLFGTIFPKRGFLLGSLALISIILFSLWKLYSEPPIFSYNPVFGFFPGPLYDEAIPITSTLVIYRLIVVCWGLFFLTALGLIRGFKQKAASPVNIIAIIMLLSVFVISHLKEGELGIGYTRDYITENFLMASLDTEHFVIYYTPGTLEAKHIALIAGDHEWRYHQLKDLLQVTSKDKIRSYIYPNTETRKKLIGAGETTIANPIHREIHLVYDSFPNPVLKHELTHVMSSEFGMKVLRVSPKVGLIEGLAVAADWNEDEFTPHQWSKVMIMSKASTNIKEIIGLGFWHASPSKSYTIMGSFVRYLIDSYGIERFKTVYKTGDFSIYGKSLDELISDWKRFLEGIPLPDNGLLLAEHRFSELGIFQAVCPRKVAILRNKGLKAFKDGNFYRAGKFLFEALNLDRSDPVLIQSLAYTYYYDGDYSKLTNIVDKDGARSLPEVDKNILVNLRGNALWQSGRVGNAKSIFEALIAKSLPDDIKREIDIKLSAISAGGEIENKLREYFGTRDKLNQVAILGEVVNKFPNYAPAYYLLGRIFFAKGDYKMAVAFSLKSELLGLPSENLLKENSRILGISLFATRDYEGAIKRFERIVNTDPDKALKDYVLDFIDRCKWAKSSELK